MSYFSCDTVPLSLSFRSGQFNIVPVLNKYSKRRLRDFAGTSYCSYESLSEIIVTLNSESSKYIHNQIKIQHLRVDACSAVVMPEESMHEITGSNPAVIHNFSNCLKFCQIFSVFTSFK